MCTLQSVLSWGSPLGIGVFLVAAALAFRLVVGAAAAIEKEAAKNRS